MYSFYCFLTSLYSHILNFDGPPDKRHKCAPQYRTKKCINKCIYYTKFVLQMYVCIDFVIIIIGEQ